MSESDPMRRISIFQKSLKFKNGPEVGGGRGVNPNWDIVISLNYCILAFIDLDLNIFQNHRYRLNNKDKNNNIYTITLIPTTIFVKFRFKDRIKKQFSFI